MTDERAEAAVRSIRWADGKPICPHCECPTVYDYRKASGAPCWRCKACRKDFSVTSVTLFASHKMPLRSYLAAITIFVNEVKGKSALALSRDLDCPYKTAFVLAHKEREAMASELQGRRLRGEGETIEVDGGNLGGYIKRANNKVHRRDRRLAKNQNGKRRVVVVMRECGGSTFPAVFRSELAASRFITAQVARGTRLMADEAGSWNDLHGSFDMARIDHSRNIATRLESIRMHRKSSFPGYAGRRLATTTMSRAHIWRGMPRKRPGARERQRRVANGAQAQAVMGLAMASSPSVEWSGYWQRAQKAA
jgi:ribosomal protein L37AE/L43A